MNLRALLIVSGLLGGIAVSANAAVGRIEKQLVIVSNPPPIQMLVPGFTVRELPLEVNNINNLVFAPDGRLFALCYDGNVLQLKDTNGDGLEDTATHFYKNDKNEILPSIGMCWGANGLYIPGQGRVIHLRDKGDGTAELRTVTGGWQPPSSAAGSNLDAIGVAVDKGGYIFFGLGVDAWNEAYRVNKVTGKSDYNIHSERGTVIKISPDWKRREIICTGMRFPVGMAFNAAGDLFATDQEGATWLPNGNPFDELLHIQPGRHYGFPPRHPKYLPDVIDEPSTFDYGPQHQSTCGLHFNEGKKVFGPDWWHGDAIVAGESRGKIWRTTLVKTAAGYVAQNHLIACAAYLTIDAVPTPDGDLLVACHTGQPDWGTGPQGKGKLFKISYTDKAAPQPVLTYATSPTETKIVFDRPLGLKKVLEIPEQYSVTMGKYATAGERFESFRPGYQVVKNQRTMPRFELAVESVRVDGNASFLIETSPRTEGVNYAWTLPGAIAGGNSDIDLQTDLTGVEAIWRPTRGDGRWSGWLPHLDLVATRGLTRGSRGHEQFFKCIERNGKLTLRAQLDLFSMLHPAVQPESKLDYEYPPETVTLVLKANAALDLKVGTNIISTGSSEARITTQPKENRWLPLEVVLATGGAPPRLDVSWFTAADPRPRPLPLRRVLLPWARPYLATAVVNRAPELESASWQRGKEIFFSEQASCFKCHQIRGEGGTIGADLSNLIYRDYASVFKDINEPSAAINPDHIAYHVQLTDGEVETGVLLKNADDEIELGQATGKSRKIPKSKVASMKASAISLMPEGLLKGLTEQQQRDLMRFLLTAH
ncbi:MAG TPA: heme-binding protein [Verrucomicrobiae bacterium]|nr:heme-binding protein [Verrucomicrobiae bacterium]